MTPLLPIPVIAVVGSRHSGKTTTVETIVRELTKKGYRVAAAKHIHGPNFTIDTEGRDTWRHAKAGAHITIAVAAKELTTIRKIDTARLSLSDITRNCEDNNSDAIIIEGFRRLVAQDPTVPKIVTVKNKNEIPEATQFFKPILAFAGEIPEAEEEQKIPIVNVTKQAGKLIELIDRRISPIIAKRREVTVSTSIEINGKPLSLNPYVQQVTRSVLLAILSTLKGASSKGNENIQIKITNPNEPTS